MISYNIVAKEHHGHKCVSIYTEVVRGEDMTELEEEQLKRFLKALDPGLRVALEAIAKGSDVEMAEQFSGPEPLVKAAIAERVRRADETGRP